MSKWSSFNRDATLSCHPSRPPAAVATSAAAASTNLCAATAPRCHERGTSEEGRGSGPPQPPALPPLLIPLPLLTATSEGQVKGEGAAGEEVPMGEGEREGAGESRGREGEESAGERIRLASAGREQRMDKTARMKPLVPGVGCTQY